MGISLNPETQKLIEERMKRTGFSTADDLVRVALQTLDQVQGEDYEQLDAETRKAIEEAEAQHERGEGIPLDEAFERLRRKRQSR
jgi:Arc/MetJ-type ribon-helix-helix transcriptional regulator